MSASIAPLKDEWWVKYRLWVLENIDVISSIETGLRTLLFLLPGRFRDSELQLEVAYSAIGLLSLHHDVIVLEYLQKEKEAMNPHLYDVNLPPPSALSASKWLSFIRYIELLIEIFTKEKFGEKAKWRAIFAVETLKAGLKLSLLWDARGTIMVHQTLPSIRDTEMLKGLVTIKQSKRERRATRRNEVSSMKWEQFKLHAQRGTEVDLPKETSIRAELLHIFRPILYLIALSKFGQMSWKPWLLAFIVDIYSVSTYLSKFLFYNSKQREEVVRRFAILMFYVLRSPFFDKLRTPFCFRRLRELQPIKRVLDSIYEGVSAYHQHYFYIAAT